MSFQCKCGKPMVQDGAVLVCSCGNVKQRPGEHDELLDQQYAAILGLEVKNHAIDTK